MNKKIIYILIPTLVITLLLSYYFFSNWSQTDESSETDRSTEISQEITKNDQDEIIVGSCIDPGDECEGGLLVNIDEEGGKLIVSAIENAENVQWGCRGQLLEITSTEYGTGSSNTEALVQWHSGWEEPWFTAPTSVGGYCHEKNDGTVAAQICQDLELNGYSDWYLPSIEELDHIYEFVHKNRKGNFEDSECWSSSESSEGSAWIKSFLSGFRYGYQKTFNRSVRCVR